MAQWTKNPTTEAWIAVEVCVPYRAWPSGLKDLALPQLWGRSQLQLRFKSLGLELPQTTGVPPAPGKKPTDDLLSKQPSLTTHVGLDLDSMSL